MPKRCLAFFMPLSCLPLNQSSGFRTIPRGWRKQRQLTCGGIMIYKSRSTFMRRMSSCLNEAPPREHMHNEILFAYTVYILTFFPYPRFLVTLAGSCYFIDCNYCIPYITHQNPMTITHQTWTNRASNLRHAADIFAAFSPFLYAGFEPMTSLLIP